MAGALVVNRGGPCKTTPCTVGRPTFSNFRDRPSTESRVEGRISARKASEVQILCRRSSVINLTTERKNIQEIKAIF